jgi:hypothetical protein
MLRIEISKNFLTSMAGRDIPTDDEILHDGNHLTEGTCEPEPTCLASGG